MRSPYPLSRRSFVTGAMASFASRSAVNAQAASPTDGLRVLRAQAAGYDGILPGPTLQVARGGEVRVRLVNELSEPTALHWHGVRLVNAMDGTPPLTQAPIAPGDSFDYRFVAPDAGTYWYHPPRHMPRSQYGILIVREAEPVDVDHDHTLIFDVAGGNAAADIALFTVNGATSFDMGAGQNERLRLRLLNASNDRILDLRLAGLRPFVMATDGEPAAPFAARDGQLVLGPGNRIDVFVDCTLDPGTTAPIVVESAGETAVVARLVGRAAGRPMRRPDPTALPANPLPERMDFASAFRLDTIVGRTEAGRAPMFTVKRGRAVMLGISNTTSENHRIHLHGHHFRLLDALDDGWKPFWLDTLPMAPASQARIAFVADNPGKWAIDGLTLGADPGAWFEVS